MDNLQLQFDTPSLTDRDDRNDIMDESSEEYIDRMFDKVSAENVSQRGLKRNVKKYIDTSIKNQANFKDSQTNSNFYELELFKLYKERIIFLEGEMRKKDDLIDKLLQNISGFTNSMINNKQTFSSYDILSKDVLKNKNAENITESPQDTHYLNNELLSPIPTTKNCVTTAQSPVKVENINHQLKNYRSLQQQNFVTLSKHKENKLINVDVNDDKILVAGDSMLHGLDEKCMPKQQHRYKIRVFPGAVIQDMYDYLNPLLKKENYKAIVLHVGTNDAKNSTSEQIVKQLLDLREFIIQRVCPSTKVIISMPILRTDDGKANYTIKKTCIQLDSRGIECVKNGNFTSKDLGKKGLHLNKLGCSKFALNINNYFKR